MADDRARHDLRELLAAEPLAVLATDQQGQPYTSLVAVAVSADLRELVFATSRATRKYRNLAKNPRASLLIDNRSNSAADFHAAMAVTALGRVVEPPADQADARRDLLRRRHPDLMDFLAAPTCATLYLAVERYFLVRRFQQVVEILP